MLEDLNRPSQNRMVWLYNAQYSYYSRVFLATEIHLFCNTLKYIGKDVVNDVGTGWSTG